VTPDATSVIFPLLVGVIRIKVGRRNEVTWYAGIVIITGIIVLVVLCGQNLKGSILNDLLVHMVDALVFFLFRGGGHEGKWGLT